MEYWKDFSPDAEESHLRKKFEPLGRTVIIHVYVDTNHAGKLGKRRPHSGILVYVNSSLINFYIKRQNTVESSSFGSEFLALIISTDMVESLRYKLRTFGVNLEGPAEVYCDNKSGVTKSSVPESVLNKINNTVCYHRVR